MARKCTPVKTRAGIANVPPDVSRGAACPDAVKDAPCNETEIITVGTLGAHGPADVLDDPLMFLPEVEKATRLSAVTIWRHEKAGKFPRRHRRGSHVVWFKSQIVAYLESLRSSPGGFAPAPVKANEARRRAA
jgi:predicted DNA-binding transcriptional regulator AlpA